MSLTNQSVGDTDRNKKISSLKEILGLLEKIAVSKRHGLKDQVDVMSSLEIIFTTIAGKPDIERFIKNFKDKKS